MDFFFDIEFILYPRFVEKKEEQKIAILDVINAFYMEILKFIDSINGQIDALWHIEMYAPPNATSNVHVSLCRIRKITSSI